MRPSSCPTTAFAPCRARISTHPFVLKVDGIDQSVRYSPAESESRQFGGNSNWRGPIWFPVNFLIIESLQKFHHYYGNDFKVECPTGSGQLSDHRGSRQRAVASPVAHLLEGRQRANAPVLRHQPQLQTDPHYQDCIPFYEYLPRRHRPRRRRLASVGLDLADRETAHASRARIAARTRAAKALPRTDAARAQVTTRYLPRAAAMALD